MQFFRIYLAVVVLGLSTALTWAEPIRGLKTQLNKKQEEATQKIEKPVPQEPAKKTPPVPKAEKPKNENPELKNPCPPEWRNKPARSRAPQGPWDLPVELNSKISIGKIYNFLNDPAETKAGKQADLQYEFKYFNHGAVTKDQLKDRKGPYFIVNWHNDDAPMDLIVRLDYRQKMTQAQVRTLEIPFEKAHGNYKATFSVTGNAYEQLGQINSWRISVVRNGVIVAQKKSFVW